MKPFRYIFALLVVASTLLSSCSLLVSSPLHYYPSPRYYSDDYESSSYVEPPRGRIYNGAFQVPADGGVFEFDCATDQFHVSKIYDSSMPVTDYNSRYATPKGNYTSANELTYEGSFYTITCNKDKHNWIIQVYPFITTSDECNEREICVLIWDGSDHSINRFQFEQISSEEIEYIH